tara:strand:+ start:296 stop:610 length:315 start_codon:yes stop_codon:yes gene_type:complete
MYRLFLIFFMMFLLASCQAAKDGLTGKKRTNADEFLVEKKNPLVLPPSYGDLPNPDNQNDISEISKSSEIKDLLNVKTDNNISEEISDATKKIENSVLEKIKNK